MSASRGRSESAFESLGVEIWSDRGVAERTREKNAESSELSGQARPTLCAHGANGKEPSLRRWFWALPNVVGVESRQIRCCGGQRAHVAVRGAEEQKKRRNAAEVVGVVVQCSACGSV